MMSQVGSRPFRLIRRMLRRDAIPLPRNWLHWAIAVLIMIGLAWTLSSIHDRRVTALSSDGETRLYPDIFWPLSYAAIGVVLLLGAVQGRRLLAVRLGRIGSRLLIVMLALGVIGGVVKVARDWFDPRPSLVLTRDDLRCGEVVRWTDIADLVLNTSRRDVSFRFQRLDAASRARNAFFSSCRISGLSMPSADIYALVQQRWRAVQPGR